MSKSDFSIYNGIEDEDSPMLLSPSGSLYEESSPLSPLGGDIGIVTPGNGMKFMSTADKMKLHAPSSSLSTPSKPIKVQHKTQSKFETPRKIHETSSVLSPKGIGLITPIGGKFQSTADKMRMSSHKSTTPTPNMSTPVATSTTGTAAAVASSAPLVAITPSISSSDSNPLEITPTKKDSLSEDLTSPTKLTVKIKLDEGSGEKTFQVDNVMSASARRHSLLVVPPPPPTLNEGGGEGGGGGEGPRTPLRQRAFSLKNPFTMSVQKASMKEKKVPIRQSIEVSHCLIYCTLYMFATVSLNCF